MNRAQRDARRVENLQRRIAAIALYETLSDRIEREGYPDHCKSTAYKYDPTCFVCAATRASVSFRGWVPER